MINPSYLCIIAACSLISVSAKADDIVLLCDPPKGQRVQFGNVYDLNGKKIISTGQGITWSEDGFSNMRPAFGWSKEQPTKLLVTWGNTIPDDLLGKVFPQKQTREAVVVYRDGDQIQAVLTTCGSRSCTTRLIGLYPRLNFMVATQLSLSTFLSPQDELAVSSTVASLCKPMR